jgi:hypothetical protein
MRLTVLSSWSAILAVAAAIACGDPPTGGGRPPEPGKPTITSSELVAGGEGRVTGTHLDVVSATTLLVDGAAVTTTAQSATEIRFRMPAPRACETDGRTVSVSAGTLTHSGRLAVPGTIALRVGESRVVAISTSSGDCLQLPAGAERYVLSFLNPSLDAAATPDPLLTVRAWTGSGAGPGASLARIPASPARAAEPTRPVFAVAAGAHTYGDSPAPLDPRYPTATVGDTLPWMDWWGSAVPNCNDARERIPMIRIVVVAVSASGKTVIAYDTRSAHGGAWTSPASAARLTRMAEMMDKWGIAAVRETMDRGYQPLRGAGGRWFHVFRTDVPGWSVDNNDAPQTACRHSSEVASTVGPDVPPQTDAQVEYLAGLAIHEYGHHAETVYRIRKWGSFTPPMRVSTTWGSLGEVWAQTVQETAARLASGQATSASYAPLNNALSNIPYADFYLNGYGETPSQSMWRVTTGAHRGGYYDQGTRFMMYLRELWGDAQIGSVRERFFIHVQELPRYDVPSLAGLVGLSATDALDRWSLAEATDDLVDPAVAAAEGLPQIRSWAPHDHAPLPSVTVSRTTDSTWPVLVGRGNYAALYLFADGEQSGKGLSLTFEQVAVTPFIARITRVR